MTAPLSPAERTRLVGILGMLGSDHDGERAAAAALASRLVREKGLSWSDLIADGGGRQGGHAGASGGPGPGATWQASLSQCLRHLPALSGWEADFCLSLSNRRKGLTPGQVTKLAQVAAELTARGLR
jgi:hypothetical protein